MASLRDRGDVDFGVLGNSKNNNLVAYNASQGEFILKSMDDVLSSDQVLDGDLPDDFVNQIEAELDLNNMELSKVDGGSF
jgi:hypothetical protein